MKKIIALVLALALILSMSTAVLAAKLKSFDDVPESHWAYDSIMRSAELGLIGGTKTPDENGVGHFDPDGMMTIAQFITVVVRAVKPGQEFDNGSSSLWYAGAWNEAVNLGILGRNDFGGVNGEKASEAITREEMAYVITNALDYMGEKPEQVVDVSRVPDLAKVSAAYRNEVLNVYSLGIICGVDDEGTFNPGGVLTRAQASAVMNRILDKESRKQVEYSRVVRGGEDVITDTQAMKNFQRFIGTPYEEIARKYYAQYKDGQFAGRTGQYIPYQIAEVQEWNEGEEHGMPKVGDIVIKPDGTRVTIEGIELGWHYIMGVGQGVNIWKGVKNYEGKQLGSAAWGHDASALLYNPATGEVHSDTEWTDIKRAYKKPTYNGTEDGQIDGFWTWTAEGQGWYCELTNKW